MILNCNFENKVLDFKGKFILSFLFKPLKKVGKI